MKIKEEVKMKLEKLIAKIIGYVKGYKELGVFHQVRPERIKMLKLALSYVRDESVEGDYFEFGVAGGSTFISAYYLAKKLRTNVQRFYAFDSFEGFPEPKGVDKEFERFKAGGANYPIHIFKKNLKKRGVDMKKVKIYKGWFEETMTPELKEELLNSNIKIAVAWIDCDMYASTKTVLDFIPFMLNQGSVLVFDDWYCYRADPNKGEQRAAKELMEKHPEIELIPFRKYGIVGNSFIVNIRR